MFNQYLVRFLPLSPKLELCSDLHLAITLHEIGIKHHLVTLTIINHPINHHFNL